MAWFKEWRKEGKVTGNTVRKKYISSTNGNSECSDTEVSRANLRYFEAIAWDVMVDHLMEIETRLSQCCDYTDLVLLFEREFFLTELCLGETAGNCGKD